MQSTVDAMMLLNIDLVSLQFVASLIFSRFLCHNFRFRCIDQQLYSFAAFSTRLNNFCNSSGDKRHHISFTWAKSVSSVSKIAYAFTATLINPL